MNIKNEIINATLNTRTIINAIVDAMNSAVAETDSSVIVNPHKQNFVRVMGSQHALEYQFRLDYMSNGLIENSLDIAIGYFLGNEEFPTGFWIQPSFLVEDETSEIPFSETERKDIEEFVILLKNKILEN